MYLDGSVRGSPGQAGVEGVLRDSSGKILYAFSEFVGLQDIISAELLAIVRAVSLCVSRPELESKKIVVVSDCKQAVNWVNSCGVGDWKYVQLIMEIRNLLGSWGQVSVEFNSRDTNSFADVWQEMELVE